ncbi:MAG: thioredoxin [Gammaproteobacteria bacterium]|nr:MAG: thioredoxin [Gammaproteobacteria bacterium]
MKKAIITLFLLFFMQNSMGQDNNKQHKFTNSLIKESSPYLLQHAHNPVNWQAWGEHAFAQAKQENKPIFLSIGYSTCHWCHVMERESFENEKIAKYLNDNFISIKVDREQLPVVDENYMMAVLISNGRGGWPSTNFLTTDGLSFYGGTYYPPDTFLNLLQQINDMWHNKNPQVLKQADNVQNAIAKFQQNQKTTDKLKNQIIKKAVNNITNIFDDMQGGFGAAPKFPHEPTLFFLLNQYQATGDDAILKMITITLDAMADGGIYDQIGGGFARYSTDNEWLVPHFEKMLYNQAHLGRIYLQAYQITKNIKYKRVATEILDYIIREMTDKNGGFYSATDADSEGEEGVFFLWTLKDLQTTLDKDDYKMIKDYYNLSKVGNFEGKNILNVQVEDVDFAKKHQLSLNEFYQKLDTIKQKMQDYRNKREKPFLDQKIISSWNAMMINTMVIGGRILQNEKYQKSAINAMDYVYHKNRDKNNQFLRMSLNNKAQTAATQEDYAYLSEALLSLYDETDDKKYLNQAIQTTDKMINLFWDEKDDGFFMGLPNKIVKMARAKDNGADNAIPSGSSVALNVLQKLKNRSDDFKYETYANKLAQSLTAKIQQRPSSYAYFLTAFDEFKNGEVSHRKYAAYGKIVINSSIKNNKLNINIKMAEKWHINANQTIKGLIATSFKAVSVNSQKGPIKLSNIIWQKPKKLFLSFADKEIPVYEHNTKIIADINPKTANFKVELKLQACSDKVCLPPEVIDLYPIAK